MELALAGQRALITGGSGGIGLACANAFAAEGVDLAIAGRSVGPLKDATRALRDGYDVAVTSHSCDLARPDHQRALAQVVGSVDIVVTATGTMASGDLDPTDGRAWRSAWDLHVFGVMNLCRLLLPAMTARGTGVIIPVVGGAGGRSFVRPGGSDPPDPLERVEAMAGSSAIEAMIVELGEATASPSGTGVRVVGVRVPPDPAAVDPASVADVVVFLASARASMVSGTVLAVDGGASRG